MAINDNTQTVQLHSISELSGIPINTSAQQDFLTKYGNILTATDTTAVIEISYKPSNEQDAKYQSYKLDFKDFMSKMYSDLTALMFLLSNSLSSSLPTDYYTREQADTKFVNIEGTQDITGQKTFLAPTIFGNNAKFNKLVQCNSEVNIGNTTTPLNLICYGNVVFNNGTFTSNGYTCLNDTAIGAPSNSKSLVVYGPEYLRRSTDSDNIIILTPTPNAKYDERYNAIVNGSINVTENAELTANHAKWTE